MSLRRSIFVVAAALSGLAGCADPSSATYYLYQVDGTQVNGDADGGYLRPFAPLPEAGVDGNAVAPVGAAPFACSFSMASNNDALTTGGGAALAGGQLFVAMGAGVQRFSTDEHGCPVEASGPLLATDFAPVHSLAIAGENLWVAGKGQVVAIDSLGTTLATCATETATDIFALSADSQGAAVGARGQSSLTFFQLTTPTTCTATDVPLTAAGDPFGPISSVTKGAADYFVLAQVDGVATVQLAHSPAPVVDIPTKLVVDSVNAKPIGACSVDVALIVPQPSGALRLLIADNSCHQILMFDDGLDFPLVPDAVFLPSEGRAIRSFAVDPLEPTAVVAVEAAPAGATSVLSFEVVTLPDN